MTEPEMKPSLPDQVLNHFLKNIVENDSFDFLTFEDLIQINSLHDLTNQDLLLRLMSINTEVDNESN